MTWRGEPPEPPKVFRRGFQMPDYGSYVCHECQREDVPALVEFYGVTVAAADGNYDGYHLVCGECLARAMKLLADPSRVETRTPLTPQERVARDLATRMHGDQKYDSDTAPYVVHLAAVRDAVIEFGFGYTEEYGEAYVVAAWLHDILEDTPCTDGEIIKLFGEKVFLLVEPVTGRGNSRRERNEDAYKKMEQIPSAIPLKLADRICNMRASKITSLDKLFLMYQNEYPAFRKRLYGPSIEFAPRTMMMWTELDKLAATKVER
jgi:hypothetical protein